jgi:tRNA U34 5-carboxymethylaminomethyl modifying GTPase MnmE/TrmE
MGLLFVTHVDSCAVTPASCIVAVIGRPNTGKSTLVNKLTNSYKDGAIVHDAPGITRDRTYRVGSWNGFNFQVVDTGDSWFNTKQCSAVGVGIEDLLSLNCVNVLYVLWRLMDGLWTAYDGRWHRV